MSDNRQSEAFRRRSGRDLVGPRPLSITADVTRGSSNMATVPRAGNISTDTRAGRPG
jgi:hypothetical protein